MRQPLRSSDNSLRIAVVTGANRGIGLEVCRQLAERDFVVLLTARDAAKANGAAKKLGKVGRVQPLALDVASASSIKKAAVEVAHRYRYLDVLVNNAGINYDTWQTVANADINGTVMETITTNLIGPWRMCQAFLPLLRKSRGGPNRECVIRIGIALGNGCRATRVSGHQSCVECADAYARG